MSTTHPYGHQIQKAIEVIARAGEELMHILSAPELASIKINVAGQINKPLMTLHSLVGTYPQRDIFSTDQVNDAIKSNNDYGPVKSFMGQPIKQRKPVNSEDLQPSDNEKQIFLDKRNDLHDRFLETSDDQLFKLALEPNGEMLIRSVAKKVMLPESFYREHPVDTDFLAAIRDKINERLELKRIADEAEQAAKDHQMMLAEKEKEQDEDEKREGSEPEPEPEQSTKKAPKKGTGKA